MLQLPRTMRTEDKIARAEIVMETLGLSGCRDTIIGEASAAAANTCLPHNECVPTTFKAPHVAACHTFGGVVHHRSWVLVNPKP
eukprot:365214-Chlamydomonas_euryale.AAC.12